MGLRLPTPPSFPARAVCTALALTGLVIPSLPARGQHDRGKAEAELGQRLAARINAWHERAADNGEALRVAYFHPAGMPPLRDYDKRVPRILEDIQLFFHEQMSQRCGFDGRLPLERNEDGSLRIHLVQGQHPAPAYQYPNGGKIRREIENFPGNRIDFANDYVLIISGLCRKRQDGSYFFHAPYYGDGSSNQVRGLCWAADCDKLDPLHLNRQALGQKFAYEEHSGKFERSLAAFNALYLGGIAHELGHGLSLPHNGELWAQRPSLGRALMGDGNYSYREDRFTDRPGTFLTLASALRLAVHPLFTRSDRGRDRQPDSSTSIAELNFSADGRDLLVDGRVDFDPELPPLAVIGYKDPPGSSGYDAKTSVAEVHPLSGKFHLRCINHKQALHELRLDFVHPNGATTREFADFYSADQRGSPDATGLAIRHLVDQVEGLWLQERHDEARALAAEQQKAGASSAEHPRYRRQIDHLLAAADSSSQHSDEGRPSPAVAADKNSQLSLLSLSAAAWADASVGWGEPRRDYYHHGAPPFRDAVLLRPGSRFHARGLYAHAPSRYRFSLGGRWKTFTAVAGLQRGVGSAGQARFLVLGDDRELYRSEVLRGTDTARIDVDVSGIDMLSLVVETARQGNGGCWSVWGSPLLRR